MKNNENICDICIKHDVMYGLETSDGDYCTLPRTDKYNLIFQQPVNTNHVYELRDNWCVYKKYSEEYQNAKETND